MVGSCHPPLERLEQEVSGVRQSGYKTKCVNMFAFLSCKSYSFFCKKLKKKLVMGRNTNAVACMSQGTAVGLGLLHHMGTRNRTLASSWAHPLPTQP